MKKFLYENNKSRQKSWVAAEQNMYNKNNAENLDYIKNGRIQLTGVTRSQVMHKSAENL